MTMHLDRGLNTVRTGRPKNSKMTVREHNEKLKAHREYNKRMKQSNNRELMMSFDEYLDFCKPKTTARSVSASKKDFVPPTAYRRDGATQAESVPSRGTGVGNASKKDSQHYSGSFVIGIAQTHKSNAVPITNGDHAKDIARMRR